MRRSVIALFVALCLLVPAGTGAVAIAADESVSVIVELRDPSAAEHAALARRAGGELSAPEVDAYRSALLAEQDDLLAELRRLNIPFAVRGLEVGDGMAIDVRYTLVLNGIALELPPGSIPSVAALADVERVHRDRVLTPDLNASVSYIGAPEVYGPTQEVTAPPSRIDGLEGQGTHIAVIDSGIDWTHEMFGGDPTPPRSGLAPDTGGNEKVDYFLSLADIVVEDGNGHGTHVASTAAGYLGGAPGHDGLPGTADDVALHGVAPQARLMAYKVCSDALGAVGDVTGAVGGCLTSSIALALEDAVSPTTLTGFPKPVADVINISLGGPGGPDDLTSTAAEGATLAGAVVVSSAGNAGPDPATIGSPAAGRRVIAAAAATDPGTDDWSADVLDPAAVDPASTGAVVPAEDLAAAQGERTDLQLFSMAGSTQPPPGSMAQRYVFVDGGETPAQWPLEASGRIGLVRTSLPATFAQVVNSGVAAGAEAVLLISEADNPTAVVAPIPGANIAPTDAGYLIGLMTGDPDVDPEHGAISNHPIRLNPFFDNLGFAGEVADFSSRGPVQGFGQVKPDVAAPGVQVLAATPPASELGALAVVLGTGPSYIAIDGTSMASPHVAGAAALVRQAHPDWNPDEVRTSLINTATNLRDSFGVPATGTASIHDQGGGLIDVPEAVGAKALMGVPGDGVEAPDILGSHSFGEVPVIDSQCDIVSRVPIEVRDISGEGGLYDLRVEDATGLRPGVRVNTSKKKVNLQPPRPATFDLTVEVDGTVVTGDPFELQWFLVAERKDGGERLRMPFVFNAVPSIGQDGDTETFMGTVPVGDLGLMAVPDLTFVDIGFEVGPATRAIEAVLDFEPTAVPDVPDLDLFLLDPEGNEVGSAASLDRPERLITEIDGPGPFTYRVSGFLNAPTDFDLTSTQLAAPQGCDMDASQG